MTSNTNEANLIMRGAEITYLNFAGKEGMYNREGDRNFCVFLDPSVVEAMQADGWNIKFTKVREEGDEPRPYIQVSVGFKFRPPKLCVVTSKGKTFLSEEECEVLDWVEMANVDLSIRPRPWSINGKEGIKAYLRSIYVTLLEDELDEVYGDIPMAVESGHKPLALEAGSSDDSPPWDTDGDTVEAELVD